MDFGCFWPLWQVMQETAARWPDFIWFLKNCLLIFSAIFSIRRAASLWWFSSLAKSSRPGSVTLLAWQKSQSTPSATLNPLMISFTSGIVSCLGRTFRFWGIGSCSWGENAANRPTKANNMEAIPIFLKLFIMIPKIVWCYASYIKQQAMESNCVIYNDYK